MNNTTGKELTPCFGKSEFAALLELSTRLGRNPLLVQASNGNTSIKLDGNIWIKASGTWLGRAYQERAFVSVELARAREAVRTDLSIPQIEGKNSSLKPSIETAMHVVLPHRVVVHVHSINTIAWAVRRDGFAHLAGRLAGLRWQWVPYSPSGVPLARQIETVLSHAPKTDVFVLANHGLVVCGEDCAGVEALLLEVERRLEIRPRVFPEPDDVLSTVISVSREWSIPALRRLHSLATDAVSRAVLKGGILYPCQAIFLGSAVRTLPHSVPLSRFREYSNGREGQRTFVVVEDMGVILHKQITEEQRATLAALARITQRIDASASLRYLTPAEVTDLMYQDQHYSSRLQAESGNEASAARSS